MHEDVDAVLEKLTHAQEEQPQEEQYSPTAESGKKRGCYSRYIGVSGGDTLGGLIGDEESPREQRGIPESESVQGMRELSPDEGTYERKGPLTIPAAVSGSQSQRRETEETEEIKPYGYSTRIFCRFYCDHDLGTWDWSRARRLLRRISASRPRRSLLLWTWVLRRIRIRVSSLVVVLRPTFVTLLSRTNHTLL